MIRLLTFLTGFALALGCWPLVAEIPESHHRYFDEDGRLRWVPPPDPSVEKLADGRVRISDLILDPRNRSVLMPVAFNAQAEEELEYVLVQVNGKLHESLLRTDTPPTYLHAAMLLLGVKQSPKRENDPETDPPPQIDQEWLQQTRAPNGPLVRLELVTVGENGEMNPYPLEDFLTDLSRDAPIESTHWVYNGSTFNRDVFVAEVEGSFISLITDPRALINYTGPGRTNDLNWVARKHPDAFQSGESPLYLRITLLDTVRKP
jgi:hypothetical protein